MPSLPPRPIHFVTRGQFSRWRDIDRLLPADIGTNPQRFRSGVDVWVAQTYLRLRAALQDGGWAPAFADRFVPGAVCVAHRDDLNDFSGWPMRSYVVGVRADRPPVLVCDQEVVQNNLEADTARRKYLPLWAQPGLVPRDAARGDRVQRIGYLGRDSSAPAWFRDPAFHAALQALGVSFEIRTQAWEDYSDFDLLLAYRDEHPTMLLHKPATKLYNAWLAGTPALLGDEPAYAALRHGELDYVAIDGPQAVLAAVRRLVQAPEVYRRMVDHGARRAAGYTVAAVTSMWLAFFNDRVAPAFDAFRADQASSRQRALRNARSLALMLQQKRAARRFRLQLEREAQRGRPVDALPARTGQR